MTPAEISPILQKALNVNIEKLAESAGANEHNLREEWESTTRKVSEFSSKYVETPAKSK